MLPNKYPLGRPKIRWIIHHPDDGGSSTSETSVYFKPTWRYIPEGYHLDGSSCRREIRMVEEGWLQDREPRRRLYHTYSPIQMNISMYDDNIL
jgi:hypothetical protein